MNIIGELYDVAQALTALEVQSNHIENIPDRQTRERVVQGHGYLQGLLADRVRSIAESLDDTEVQIPATVQATTEISTH